MFEIENNKRYISLMPSLFQEVSIFIFEKRCAEKLHKPKRKETVTEILRNSVKQLERFRHPKVRSTIALSLSTAQSYKFLLI